MKRHPVVILLGIFALMLAWHGCGVYQGSSQNKAANNHADPASRPDDPDSRDDEPPSQPAAWSSASPMPAARYGATGAVIGDKIYIVGGGSGGGPSNELFMYDPVADSWTSRTPMPTARHWAGAAVIDGKLYVVGGVSASNATLGTLEVYDPATDTWATMSPMNQVRFAPATGGVGGLLVVAGGGRNNAENPGVPRNTVEVYDPASDKWLLKSSTMPVALYDTASEAVGDKLYVAGGWDGASRSAVLEVYDPVADTWMVKQSLQKARQAPGSAVVNGKLYVAGGWDRDTNNNMSAVEAYDPAGDKWTDVLPMPHGRQQPVAGYVQGKFYVFGGYDGAALSLNELLPVGGSCR